MYPTLQSPLNRVNWDTQLACQMEVRAPTSAGSEDERRTLLTLRGDALCSPTVPRNAAALSEDRPPLASEQRATITD